MTQETQKPLVWVCVDAVSTFRMRYMVQVPEDHPEWAEESVAMGDLPQTPLNEFSQRHIGEQIVSSRVISEQDALELCVSDNEYVSGWEPERLKECFFTPWVDPETKLYPDNGKYAAYVNSMTV